MSKRKLYMKYLVLKMEDRIDVLQLCDSLREFVHPKIRDIAEHILNSLYEEAEE